MIALAVSPFAFWVLKVAEYSADGRPAFVQFAGDTCRVPAVEVMVCEGLGDESGVAAPCWITGSDLRIDGGFVTTI